MYIHVPTHLQSCFLAEVCIYIYICVRVYNTVCMYMCMYVCVYTSVCMYVCMYVNVRECMCKRRERFKGREGGTWPKH